jgi:hypothetical protein
MMTGTVNADLEPLLRLTTRAADAQPLLGMALMHGSDLRIQVVPGGAVTIAELP